MTLQTSANRRRVRPIDLRQGDCLEVMPQLPDASVDMVLCDLPYGETACHWDVRIDLPPLWAQYARLLRRPGVVVLTATNPYAAMLIHSKMDWYRYDWVWEKSSAKGHLSASERPLRAHEMVLVFSPGKPAYYPQMWKIDEVFRTKRKTLTMTGSTGVYGEEGKQRKLDDGTRFPRSVMLFGNAPSKIASRNHHATQKPVALLEYLIRTYTTPGGVVLDNTMGSGSTGVACASSGRNFIGIEKDPTIFQSAKDRLFPSLALNATT